MSEQAFVESSCGKLCPVQISNRSKTKSMARFSLERAQSWDLSVQAFSFQLLSVHVCRYMLLTYGQVLE